MSCRARATSRPCPFNSLTWSPYYPPSNSVALPQLVRVAGSTPNLSPAVTRRTALPLRPRPRHLDTATRRSRPRPTQLPVPAHTRHRAHRRPSCTNNTKSEEVPVRRRSGRTSTVRASVRLCILRNFQHLRHRPEAIFLRGLFGLEVLPHNDILPLADSAQGPLPDRFSTFPAPARPTAPVYERQPGAHPERHRQQSRSKGARRGTPRGSASPFRVLRGRHDRPSWSAELTPQRNSGQHRGKRPGRVVRPRSRTVRRRDSLEAHHGNSALQSSTILPRRGR